MIRFTYRKLEKLAHHPRAAWVLFGVAFAESSFFPIPPDAMLIPLVLTNRERAWWFAAICTAGSVAGGLAGYAIGAWLYDTLGHWLVEAYGLGPQIETFRQAYAHYGAWIILIKGLTPIPYKLVTIASGLAGYSLPMFLLLSVIVRGGRFFALTALLTAYGEPIRQFIEKRMEWVALYMACAIVVGFAAFKWLL
jgi:membrane protein YqaA with SNARE-associated domain